MAVNSCASLSKNNFSSWSRRRKIDMKPIRTTLSLEQCNTLTAQMSLRDKSLFLALLMCGAEARMWTWMNAIEKSLDMPIALWFVLRDYAGSRGLVISPFADRGVGSKEAGEGIRVH